MDIRVLLGIIVAAVVAVAVIVGGRAYLNLTVTAPPPVTETAAPEALSAAEPAPGGSETGNADLDQVLGAARETLVTLSPAPAQQPAADSAADRAALGTEPRVEASGAPADPDAPTFDIVRVEPDGSAVIAGRAAPGATVSILDAGASIGEATADGRGQWVFLPDTPLASGARELSLSARGGQAAAPSPALGEGNAVRQSPTVVMLSVPDRDTSPGGQADPAPVLALEAPRVGGGTGRLLQGPVPEVARGTLQVGRVDYSSSGALSLSGTAQPGTVVQLYMDNAPVARAEADAVGAWTARPDTNGLEERVYTLRVDQVGSDGGVEQRVELPFQHTDFTFRQGEAGENLLVVQPGNNLWRVARAVYGQGTDYTVIYQANADQIRNPDLIYPGQVFVVPAGGARTANE